MEKDRRSHEDVKQAMTEIYKDQENHWHISKGVSVSTIIAVVGVLITTSYQIGLVKTQLEADQRATIAMIDAINSKVEALTTDRVHKATVDQMFLARDQRLDALEDRLDRIDDRLQRNFDLLQKIHNKIQ